MCLLNQFIIITNLNNQNINLLMKYNQLSYHKANPFHKQGYIPDRGWYNRQQKEFPSQIPTGKQYFVEVGRRHYQGKFNHSEIDDDSILKSPERFPFENRIALDKNFMRSLDTIDIEGAASGTRVNQSVKNKFKAKQQLARRNHQSIDFSEDKEKTYDEKRRSIALKQYDDVQQKLKSSREIHQKTSNNRPNYQMQGKYKTPELHQHNLTEEYNEYIMNNSSNKYIKRNPKGQYNPEMEKQYQQLKRNSQNSPYPYNPDKYGQQRAEKNSYRPQSIEKDYKTVQIPQETQRTELVKQYQYLRAKEKEDKERENFLKNNMSVNNKYKSNPDYLSIYDKELVRRRDEFQKYNELDEMCKQKMKSGLRRNNPTNLSVSFNVAAQNIMQPK